MSFRTLFFSLATVIFLTSAQASAEESAAEILKKADAIRNPGNSYFMKVEVKSTGNEDEPSIYEVFLKGNSKTLVKALAPARDKGRNMLMIDEDMWAYVPNLKRAVRVSLNQKLSGQTANGDISRTRWTGDYTPTIESSDAKYWKLYLKADKKGLTYDRIRVWVQKKTYKPEKAEYLSLSDKVLKKVEYKGFKPMAGGDRPTEIHIQDALNETERSVIAIQSMEVKDHPDSLFNQNNLKWFFRF